LIAHVQQDDVHRPPRHRRQAGLAARHGLDVVALVAQHARQRRPDAGLIVDDQDGWLHNQ
jgi:hypothetical protein